MIHFPAREGAFFRLLFSFLAIALPLLAVPVQPDPTFATGTGANSTVNSLSRQSDGAIWMGGSFSTVQGVSRAGIAKLTAGGTLDTTFVPPTTANQVNCVAQDGNGNVLVGLYSMGSIRGIVRLTATGAIDPGFSAVAAVNYTVRDIEVLPDGNILIGGDSNHVALLTPSGAAVATFASSADESGTVYSIQSLPSGKIMVGGSFSTFRGAPRTNLCVLLPNGSLDPSFNPNGDGPSSAVRDLALQTDGKILLAGNFYSYRGNSVSNLMRISADGTFDRYFRPNPGNTVYSVKTLPDGRILAGGTFTTADSMTRQRIALFRADGKVDSGFDTTVGASAEVDALCVLPDNRIVIGGTFATLAGTTVTRIGGLTAPAAGDPSVGSLQPMAGPPGTELEITGSSLSGLTAIQFPGGVSAVFTVTSDTTARVIVPAGAVFGPLVLTGPAGTSATPMPFFTDAPGTLDPAFDVGSGASSTVHDLVRDDAGRLYAAGSFTTFNAMARSGIVRLLENGSPDPTFTTATANSTNYCVAVQADGKILLGGSTPAGKTGVARLNPDGSRDNGFDASNAFTGSATVYAIAVQPDGKILIGGNFSRNLARLHPDGSLDTTFNVGSGASSTVYALALQPDGKILVGGSFSTYNGGPFKNVARLSPTGVAEPGFPAGTGVSGGVKSLALQQDGAVLIAGDFYSVNGNSTVKYLARLRTDGTLDTAFLPLVPDPLRMMRLAADGRIAIAGDFISIASESRNYAALLHADGKLVTAFNTTGGPTSTVYAALPASDGSVVIGGSFSTVGGQNVPKLARLQGDQGKSRPAISQIAPESGAVGDRVVISGSRLGALTGADFAGGVTASVFPISETRAEILVPAGSMSGRITLRNAHGEALSPGIFRLFPKPAPVVTGIPATPVGIGNPVTVTGTNFYDVTQVRIGVLTAAFTIDSPTQMTVTVPADALSARVIVSGPGGTSQSATDLIVVKAPPVLTSATTAEGTVGKIFSFQLAATNGPAQFTATPLPSGLQLDAATGKITGIPLAEGNAALTTSATNAGGTAVGTLAITIAAPGPPTIGSVSPAQVPAGGRILVGGNQLFQTTGVTVGGIAAVFEVLSDTRLAVTLPAGSTGGTIVVTTSQGAVTSTGSVSVWDFQGGTQSVAASGENASGESTPPPDLADTLAISAGLYHSLALRADGRITGWGGNWAGQATPPEAVAPAVGIAAGGFHSLALQADGTVAGWGRNDEGQCSNTLKNVAAISAGGYHSLGLLRTGQVMAWGSNTDGQSAVPETLGGVIAVAAGYNFSAALQSDGKVVCWGGNAYGQCDVPAAAQTGVTAISAGFSHMVAVKSDGTVVAWGANWANQTSVPPALDQVIAIAAGSHHTLAIRTDGSVVTWGGNWAGQRLLPTEVTEVRHIAAGGDHSLFLSSPAPGPRISSDLHVSGKPTEPLTYAVTAVGDSPSYSAEGLPTGLTIDPVTGTISGTPTRGGDTLVTVVARNPHGLARRNVRFFIGPYVIGWGKALPVPIPSLATVVQVAAGDSHCIALLADGTVTGWGSNNYGERTIPNGLNNVVAVAAGSDFSMALKADGNVYGWGRRPAGGSWAPGNLVATNIVTLEAKGGNAVGLTRTGGVYILSSNFKDGYVTSGGLISTTPFPGDEYSYSSDLFGTLNREGSVFAGLSTTWSTSSGFDKLAIGSIGYSWAPYPPVWALKRSGVMNELQRSRYSSSAPTTLPTAVTDGVDIAAGDFFALALKADASVVLLQATPDPDDRYGYPTTPVAGPTTDTLVGVTGIAARLSYAIAIKSPSAGLRITSPRVLEGRTGSPFTHQVTATGASIQYSATFLPAGLSIHPNSGKISGTPTGTGTSSFLVIAKSATGIATQAISVKLTNGVPPVDLTLSGMTVAEDAPVGTVVGTFAAVDYSPSDTFTFALVSGSGSTDNAKFTISGNTLKTNAALDHEALPIASIRVQVTDSGGNPFAKVFQIDVPDATTDDDDDDGLNQAEEVLLGTDPAKADTDQDGASDGLEIVAGSLPLNATSRPANYVAAWGQNSSGQCTVPRNLGPVVAIAAGDSHSLALQEDGTVAAWGSNGSGQCNVPADLTDVIAIAAGSSHSLALKADGTVVAWGSTSYDLNVIPPGLDNVIEIAASDYNSVALTADGQVVAWGQTYDGLTEVPAEAQGAVHIAAGANVLYALPKSGNWVTWGSDTYGYAAVANQSQDLVEIAASDTLTLGLTTAGQLRTWGTSTFGANQPPADLPTSIQIAAGSYFGSSLGSDGSVAAWGYNTYGQANVPLGLAPARAIESGDYHLLALCGTAAPAHFLTTRVEIVTGVPFQRQLSFSGSADWFEAHFLPPGVAFDPLTATFSGVTAQSDSTRVRVTAGTGRSRITKIIALNSSPPRSFADWRIANGGAPLGSPLADPDGDAVANLMEYALQTDPSHSGSKPAVQGSVMTVSGNRHLALTYQRVSGATDLRYLVEVSADLLSWSAGPGATAEVGISAMGDSETVTVRDATPIGNNARRFIRLRVEQTDAN